MTADIHLDALREEKNKRVRGRKKKQESNPKATARNGGECVIMVTKATACCPVGQGEARRKVRRLRHIQLNQL